MVTCAGTGEIYREVTTEKSMYGSLVDQYSNTMTMGNDFCTLMLYDEFSGTKIRYWDLIVLIPNLAFLLFLVIRFPKALLKLRATSSSIFLTFYCLVFINVFISVLRSCASMLFASTYLFGISADIVLWTIVRFFMLFTEISVLIFGLAFGHLDSRSSIRYVLTATSLISFAYTLVQTLLEVFMHDLHYNVDSRRIILFGHGGVLFDLCSCILFSVVYFVLVTLPWTRYRHRFALPAKQSFYIYVASLMILCELCGFGDFMMLMHITQGLCVVNVTKCIYYSLYTPLVYYTFLCDFFEVSEQNILFSYKNQNDDTIEEDCVSLPHHHSCSSIKTDAGYFYENSKKHQGTQFDTDNFIPTNPLYMASLQSPDSIAGYSLDSQVIDLPPISKP